MLLINESQLLRKIIKAYVLAELTDMVVEAVETSEEGLDQARQKEYDLILSGQEMTGLDGIEIFKRLKQSGPNQDTPFILMTSTSSVEQQERLARAGLKHILYSPFTAEKLARLIDEVSHPRDKRQHARFNIAGAEAWVYMGEQGVSVAALNVSRAGLLGEFKPPRAYQTSWRPVKLDLIFPADYGSRRIEGVSASPVRAEVMSWQEDDTPKVMRMAWHFLDLSGAAGRALDEVLGQAKADEEAGRRRLESD
jgi:CheY-like chemotaxis protein